MPITPPGPPARPVEAADLATRAADELAPLLRPLLEEAGRRSEADAARAPVAVTEQVLHRLVMTLPAGLPALLRQDDVRDAQQALEVARRRAAASQWPRGLVPIARWAFGALSPGERDGRRGARRQARLAVRVAESERRDAVVGLVLVPLVDARVRDELRERLGHTRAHGGEGAEVQRAEGEGAEARPTRWGHEAVTGLRRLDDPEWFLRTSDSDAVEALLRLPGAVRLAIAGPRGVGKSALLRRLAGPAAPRQEGQLRVLVTAPAGGSPIDVTVDLFTQVCTAVLRGPADGAARPEVGSAALRSPGRVTIARGVAVVALAATVGLLARAQVASLGGLAVDHPWALTGAVALVAAAAAVRLRPSPSPGGYDDATTQLATWHLERLRNLRVRSDEARAALALPAGAELMGRTTAVQRVEQPRTYAELVDELRGFLRVIGSDLARDPVPGRVLVAVDDLDKLAPQEADRMADRLRTIFHGTGCSYVVSVPDALADAHDRRAVAPPGAADGAFDAVRRLEPLTVAEAGDLLAALGVTVPVATAAVCHAVAGGLPRELARVVTTAARAPSSGAADVGALLIGSELDAVLPERVAVGPAGVAVGAEAIERLVPALADPGAVAFTYFLATVCRALAEATPGDPANGLAALAPARVAGVTDPARSWRITSEYRAGRGWPVAAWPRTFAPRSQEDGGGRAT